MNAEERKRRVEEFLQRVDTRLKKIEEITARSEQEFELNREIHVEVLRRIGENHLEALRRSDDLSEHMREQTQALMRINERLGP